MSEDLKMEIDVVSGDENEEVSECDSDCDSECSRHLNETDSDDDSDGEDDADDDQEDIKMEMTDNGHAETNEIELPYTKFDPDMMWTIDKSCYEVLYRDEDYQFFYSFDIITNRAESEQCSALMQDSYPKNVTVVAGTQNMRKKDNRIAIVRFSNVNRLKDLPSDDDDDGDGDDDDADVKEMIISSSDDEEPEPEPETNGSKSYSNKTRAKFVSFKHPGPVNKVKFTNRNDRNLMVSYSSNGSINIWDLKGELKALENNANYTAYTKKHKNSPVKPLFAFKGDHNRGFAIDWNRNDALVLASANANGQIYCWKPTESGSWQVSRLKTRTNHESSIECLQWSPNEPWLLATCSTDRTIRLWDTRCSATDTNGVRVRKNAHNGDVNVIDWNARDTNMLLSAGDDGVLNVWDLKRFESSDEPALATFDTHKVPIYAAEWSPHESSVFASSCRNDALFQWDLAAENDESCPLAMAGGDASAAIQAAPKPKSRTIRRGGARKSKKNKVKKEKAVADSSRTAAIPEQLMFIHQGQTELTELHWHPQYAGLMVTSARSGFNIFKSVCT